MSAFGPSIIAPSNASNNIGVWADFVHDSLVGAGWVQTSDSGQATPASLTTPGGASTKGGYCIYRMADSLQATAPVFLRIDYGSAGAANTPAMWLTIGTGSDGSGTITGIIFNGGSTTAPTLAPATNSTTGTTYSVASGSTNRIAITCFCQGTNSTTNYILGFQIERRKDATGADDGSGLLLTLMAATINHPVAGALPSNAYATQYLPLIGSVPPVSRGLAYVLYNNNPSTFSSDVGVGIPYHFAGPALPPGTQLLVCRSSDFISGATPTLSLYGESITYFRCDTTSTIGLSTTASADTSAVILVRFD